MKITKIHNLPEAMLKAMSFGEGLREGYSVTDLEKPPRELQLIRRHWDEIVVDASEMLWALLGKSMHYILEKGATEGSLTEERLSVTIDGFTIHGHSDLWKNRTIEDYKVTSTWTLIYNPGGRRDWIAQLNMYLFLWVANGFPTDKLVVWVILRDWMQSKAKYDHTYPQIPLVRIDIPVWRAIDTLDYIRNRIAVHQEAMNMPDDSLPECTAEEMWEKRTTYAVKKEGRKTALRVLNSSTEATDYMDEKCLKKDGTPDPAISIEVRKGCRIKCDDYCSASPFCNQYKKYKEVNK